MSLLKHLIALSILGAATAHAQFLTLDVQPSGVLDTEALAQSIRNDLGLEVQFVDSPEHAEVVIERVEGGAIRITVHPENAPPVSRSTEGADDRTELTLRIALLLSNLMRDESRELVDLLGVRPPPPPPAPTPVSPPDAPLQEMPFAIDFAPGVGFSSGTQGHDWRGFSLGAIGALSGSVRGFALSGVSDIVTGSVSGLQIGGVLAFSGGPFEGLQIGGVAALSGHDFRGLQLGLVDVALGRLEGAQLGLVNVATSDVSGAQIGLVNTSTSLYGAQIGLVNIAAGAVTGAQIGLVNIGTRVHGLQLGLVNVAEEADASIGLVPIQTQSRAQLRVGADTTGLFGLSVVHGGRVTHGILSAAFDPLGARLTFAVGAGFGVRAQLYEDAYIDIDGVAYLLLDGTLGQAPPTLLVEPRVVFGIDLVPRTLGLYFGVSYQFHVSNVIEPDVRGALGVTDIGASPWVRGWPALLGGVQFF